MTVNWISWDFRPSVRQNNQFKYIIFWDFCFFAKMLDEKGDTTHIYLYLYGNSEATASSQKSFWVFCIMQKYVRLHPFLLFSVMILYVKNLVCGQETKINSSEHQDTIDTILLTAFIKKNNNREQTTHLASCFIRCPLCLTANRFYFK